jgi:hypothetical protein
LLTIIFVVFHLRTTSSPRRELRLVVAATFLGISADSLLVLGGALSFFPQHALGPLPTPLWMVALWTGFGATLSATFSFALRSKKTALLFGGLAGPLAYWGGQSLGRIQLAPSSPALGLFEVGICWALAMLILRELAIRPESHFFTGQRKTTQ